MENQAKRNWRGRGSQPRRTRFQDSIKYLTKEDWQQLRESLDHFRDKVLVTFLYSTGCRVGELCTMRIEDVDFQEGFIRIPGQHTKTKEPRTVRVGREVLSDLRAYLTLEKRKSGGLLRSRQEKSISPRRVQQIVARFARKAGIERVTPHTLRHTHIAHALLYKVPITAVQKQVGHKRLTTTQIYADLAPEQVKEAYEHARLE